MTRYVLILVLGLVVGGCSPDGYRRSADRQVQRIITDRTERALGYTPEVEVATPVDTRPGKTAFVKVPLTPLPPVLPSPIEPAEAVELPVEPLGPQELLPPGVDGPDHAFHGVDLDEWRTALRLGPPSPGLDVVRLDLFGAIAYAVQNSREYSAEMEDLYLAALEITLQRHLFSPRPFARSALRYSGGQRAVDFRSALTVANSVGIRQRLPYGGEVTAEALVDFVTALSGNAQDAEAASVVLTASIPLLRGAGMINLEPLINSERQVVYQVRGFEQFRRTFVVNISTQYFRLLSRLQAIADRRTNLENLRSLTERTRALYAAGKLNFLDVQRALQQQLVAENDLIDAEAAYQSALDAFKLTLGVPIDQPLEVVPSELEVRVPTYEPDEAIELARLYRLDLQTVRDQIEDAQRGVRNAKNGLLPDLDFVARGRVTNEPDTAARHLTTDTATYSAALELDLPIDRLAERNAYRRALIRLERAQRAYDRVNDQVAAEAREALRQIRSAQVSLEIQRRGIELAELRLENANELLRQGRRDSRDVVEAQAALLRAQDAFENARANLQIQVLRFLRDTGTLRVDPDAGAIGQAMDRAADPAPRQPLPVIDHWTEPNMEAQASPANSVGG